ncbi:MAG TPA: 5'-nucleotidase C-terminal domain-containing protein [Salinivirgaceae bacterium]|nr:5'-nucleotidase C-terminal domain-containing protein [Salinivirgaceae bacterium]
MDRTLFTIILVSVAFLGLSSCSKSVKNIDIVVTTDTHGNLFSIDPISGQVKKNSLSQVAKLVDSLRKQSQTLLFDNGDLLQGSPEVYYLNYQHQSEIHPIVEIMKTLGYNAMVIGNHDIECGPEIYHKLKHQLSIPWLAANIIDTKRGEPYFKPYHVFRIHGIKIAVLGLTTPGVPQWLPEKLWQGLKFDDMVESARKWMKILRDKEQPDFVIGLFHSGWDATYGNADPSAPYNENASLRVAAEVDGFDLIFLGHDHQTKKFSVINVSGKNVIIIDCGSHALSVGRARLSLNKGTISLDSAWYENISTLPPLQSFDQKFDYLLSHISTWINQPIAYLKGSINTFDALLKPSAYINLIHKVQLVNSNASISLASPFTYHKNFNNDTIRLADVFTLYPYENQLYSVKLSGKEIQQILTESYNRWFNPKFPNEKLLVYEKIDNKVRWSKPPFTFVTAGGVQYTVKFQNNKPIEINNIKLTSGENLLPDKTYMVALNSYMASGGDGYLTDLINLNLEELKRRVISISGKEIRWLIVDYLQTMKTIEADDTQNWRVEPHESWIKTIEHEKVLFFNQQP